MITSCTKEQTKGLEHTTVPIVTMLPFIKHHERHIALISWYMKNGIDTNAPQYKQNAKLTELIGFEPQYHAVRGSDNYRNAIWGFEYKGDGCVLYHSKRGLGLQVAPEMEKDSAVDLLDLLIEKFNCNDQS